MVTMSSRCVDCGLRSIAEVVLVYCVTRIKAIDSVLRCSIRVFGRNEGVEVV